MQEQDFTKGIREGLVSLVGCEDVADMFVSEKGAQKKESEKISEHKTALRRVNIAQMQKYRKKGY